MRFALYAQGQAIQWSKEKGQSLIYKTFPPQRYIFSQETKNQILKRQQTSRFHYGSKVPAD
jgi:hypothetical protein